jgi:ABC-2 type transport system permease protein
MNDPMFLRQLRNECFKVFSRKRTYLGFGIFLALHLVTLWLLQQPLPRKGIHTLLVGNGFRLEDFAGGLTVAAFTMVFTVALVSGLYLALLSGDLVAREVEDGTMRMVLARPISRARLFLAKTLVGALHTFSLMAFVGLSGLLVGWVGHGRLGMMLVFAPLEGVFGAFDTAEGLQRYLLATLLLGVVYQAVAALALMFSCLRIRPATATVLTLSVLYVDFVLNNIPYLSPFRPFFLSHHLAAWVLVFRPDIPWRDIASSLLVLLGLGTSFLVIGLGFFENRDIKT